MPMIKSPPIWQAVIWGRLREKSLAPAVPLKPPPHAALIK
jgi:hypothetical protein